MESSSLKKIEVWVQSVKAGDPSEFRGIVETMLPILRAYVAPRSLPGMDLDEVVQRVCIEAYKSIGQYRQGTDFRAWLITIARYQTMMEATRLRRQADYHSRFVPIAIARQMETRLANEDAEDDRLLYLRECLQQVKASSRELIRRRYEDDLSMNDIADALKRMGGAVRKELCLVRKQLHECVERIGSDASTPEEVAIFDGSFGQQDFVLVEHTIAWGAAGAIEAS